MEAGVAGVSGDSKDRAFWGQYNGMRYQDAYGILNFDYSRLDTSTGTWLDVTGSNLGLQTRDLGVFWSRQGDWTLGGSLQRTLERQSVHGEQRRGGTGNDDTHRNVSDGRRGLGV